MKTKVLRYLCLLLLLCFINTTLPMANAWSTSEGYTVVYVTATGDKYHSGNCGYLKSKYKTTLLEALIDGYSPCSRCNPPIYTGVVPTEATEITDNKASGSYGSSGRRNNSSTKGTDTKASTNIPDKKSSSRTDWAAFLVLGLVTTIPVTLWIADAITKSRRVRKANSEWDKTHNVIGLQRKRCVDCKYCVWRIHHPFPSGKYRNVATSKYPTYCKKLRRPLSCSEDLRCQAEYHSQTMYEDTFDSVQHL